MTRVQGIFFIVNFQNITPGIVQKELGIKEKGETPTEFLKQFGDYTPFTLLR